jgi:peptide/nickel transport system substrate-binding protein
MIKKIYFKFSTLLVLLLVLIFLSSCKEENKKDQSSFTITVRISKDPSFLNPLKTSGTAEAIINQYIFLPLANYHPQSLELMPILLDSIPEGVEINSGEHAGSLRFDCRMKEDAKWKDDSPITGYDYLFTIKAIKYPPLQVNPSFRSVFKQLKDIQVDPLDPKRFSVFVDKDYFLGKELALVAEVLPEHIYDSAKSLRAIPFVSLDGVEKMDPPVDNDSIQSFITSFNHADCGRSLVAGSGPYQLKDWMTNQRVVLEEKNDYWGDNYPDNPYLQSYPKQIHFSIIPSDETAITELKNGNIDLLYRINGINFSKLKEDSLTTSLFSFHSPAQLKYYYIGINNHSPFFEDKRCRKALSHLIDLDLFIKNHENGMGLRLNGPIHPISSYYNDTLQNIRRNPSLARELLYEAGWKDTNGDGTLDKMIEGKRKELKPILLTTGGSISRNLALTLKERGQEVGMDIEVITKNSKLIRSEIAKRNFDLYPTGINYGLYPLDLYQMWHSSNDYPGGRNRFGFSNAKADEIIEKIRVTKDSTTLDHLYREIQVIIYEEQPWMFLYAPTNNIAVNKHFSPVITVKKHGFFLNAFELNN